MDGLGAEGALIAMRAIHFAATTITAGTLLFRTVIAAPVLRTEAGVGDAFQTQTQCVLWASLLVTAISGAIWLLVQAASRRFRTARRGKAIRLRSGGRLGATSASRKCSPTLTGRCSCRSSHRAGAFCSMTSPSTKAVILSTLRA